MGVLLVMFVPRSVLQKSKSTAGTEHIDVVKSPSSSSFHDELSNKNNIQEIPSRSQETETYELKNENEAEDEDEDVICYSKQQRWPLKGEPVCVVCGRYGEYIVDQTDKDVCSLECKANHLHSLGLKEISIETSPNKGNIGMSPVDRNKGIGNTKWNSSCDVYQEHPFITSMTNEQVDYLRQEVIICLYVCTHLSIPMYCISSFHSYASIHTYVLYIIYTCLCIYLCPCVVPIYPWLSIYPYLCVVYHLYMPMHLFMPMCSTHLSMVKHLSIPMCCISSIHAYASIYAHV